MSTLVYPLFIWKNHRGFFVFSFIIIAMMQFLVITLVSSMETGPIMDVMMQQLPERFQTLINEQFLSGLTLKGAAAFGFNHPLVLALLVIYAINIPNRHISTEIETGTLELLLAYPFRRTTLLISLWMATGLLLLLIICGAWAGSFAAIFLQEALSLDLFMQMLKIGLNLWLLLILIMSYTLLIATFMKTGSKAGFYGAGVTLIFYFGNFLTALWKPISFVEPINIFTYFQPQKLMFDQRSLWLNVTVLSTLIVICLILSVRQFNRRDIPG